MDKLRSNFLFGTEILRKHKTVWEIFHKDLDKTKDTMSFSDLLALRKAKLGGKYISPEGVMERGQPGVEEEDREEVVAGVSGDSSEEVMEERSERDEAKIGENQRRNFTSIVRRLEPTVVPENGTIKTSAGFMLVEEPDKEEVDNLEVSENNKKGKKRTLADRLQEPIKVKKAGRCKKVNVTSWRNQVLTMKKKASRMQIEAGTEPNFLIIMFNNVQDPHASNPSASAGKYLTYGEGPIKEKLVKEGLKFDKSMYLMANNFNFAEEIISEENAPGDNLVDLATRVAEERSVKKMRIGCKAQEKTDSRFSGVKVAQIQRRREEEENKELRMGIRRECEEREDTSGGLKDTAAEDVQKVPMEEKLVKKKWKPKKVATPGTFLDTLRMSSSEED